MNFHRAAEAGSDQVLFCADKSVETLRISPGLPLLLLLIMKVSHLERSLKKTKLYVTIREKRCASNNDIESVCPR